jgi:hypothetical protein
MNYFAVFTNGTVTQQDGSVICTTGGDACLQEWIDLNIWNLSVTNKVGDDTYKFNIYKNGTVTFINGTLLHNTDGQVAIDHWLIAQMTPST